MPNDKAYEIICNTKDMPEDVWLKWRKVGVGGSDAAAALGVSPWTTKTKLYLIKKSLLPENDIDPIAAERMYFGNVLEEVVAKEFVKRSGKKVQKRNAMFRSAKYPWMIANIDRFVVGENAALECKTASAMSLAEWESGQIPIQYEAQIQHYIAVLDLDKIYVACLVGGQRFFFYEVLRDQTVIDQLIEAERDFWVNNVLAEVIPPVVTNDVDVIKELYPTATEEEPKELGEDYIAKCEEFNALKVQIKALENRKDQLQAEFEAELKTFGSATADKYIVKWSNSKRTGFDSKRLKEEDAALYEKYVTESTSRRFDISIKKEKKEKKADGTKADKK